MAPVALHRRALLHAYGYKNRQPQTATPRKPRRVRKKRTQTATPKERAAARKLRREHKLRLHGALDDSLAVVWHEAERLHEDLGVHSPKKFYEMLLQRGGKKTRKPNRWNMWLHKRRGEKVAGT